MSTPWKKFPPPKLILFEIFHFKFQNCQNGVIPFKIENKKYHKRKALIFAREDNFATIMNGHCVN